MPVTYQDNLAYHFYGGIHLAVARHYEQAIQLLETVSVMKGDATEVREVSDPLRIYKAVSAPSQPASTSSMQISAYQYLILCQLLLQGKVSKKVHHSSQSLNNAKYPTYILLHVREDCTSR